jgi:Tol biopolymer transport system component
MARLALILSVLATLVAAAPAAATYPGRNGAIAYGQNAGSGDGEPVTHSSAILLQRSRSADPRILVKCAFTDDVPSGDCTATDYYSLSFSSDGRQIAFDAGERIGIVAVAGGAVRLLPGVTANDGDPALSPDGRQIVFTGANDHGTTDLYTRRADGAGGARLLIQDAGQPAFSARGVLAYVRSGNVYLRLPNKGRRLWVTSGVSPDWSPDGKRLAIVRPRPSLTFDIPIGRIYTVRPNGRGLTQVGREGYAGNPVWSPDGRWIAYDGLDLGVHVKLVGTHKQAREWAPTQYSGESGFIASGSPAWRPLP